MKKEMKKKYTVKGMTCQGCRAHVEDALQAIPTVRNAEVSLEKELAEVELTENTQLDVLQKSIGEKYSITPYVVSDTIQEPKENDVAIDKAHAQGRLSKLKQLFPLFLIFFYITTASILINFSDFTFSDWMFDFMGLFFIVFSFFKFLDYKGFPASFKMYDPLAKLIPAYAWSYPFLESILGLLFLFRFQIETALVLTLIFLGITSIGVTRSLFSKQKIKCACLGTALNLPMTEATFIENTIMIAMASTMLIKITLY